jgi:Ras-related protein Rab-18
MELDTYTPDKNVIKIIVGNKSDKEISGGREVAKKEGENLAKQMGTLFIETSAKTTMGVHDAFEEVVQKVLFG